MCLKPLFVFGKGEYMLIDKKKLDLLQRNLQKAFNNSIADMQDGDKFAGQIWIPITNYRCPLCGSKHGCLINYQGTEVICQHTMSSRRVGLHSWLHKLVSKNNDVLVQN